MANRVVPLPKGKITTPTCLGLRTIISTTVGDTNSFIMQLLSKTNIRYQMVTCPMTLPDPKGHVVPRVCYQFAK